MFDVFSLFLQLFVLLILLTFLLDFYIVIYCIFLDLLIEFAYCLLISMGSFLRSKGFFSWVFNGFLGFLFSFSWVFIVFVAYSLSFCCIWSHFVCPSNISRKKEEKSQNRQSNPPTPKRLLCCDARWCAMQRTPSSQGSWLLERCEAESPLLTLGLLKILFFLRKIRPFRL